MSVFTKKTNEEEIDEHFLKLLGCGDVGRVWSKRWCVTPPYFKCKDTA
jgi:hypothetical protein